MKKVKEFFQRPVFKKIGPVIRPFVKMVPVFGPPITELATTLLTPTDQPRKHSSVSQIISWVIAGVVVLDVVVNKGANLVVILDLFKELVQESPAV